MFVTPVLGMLPPRTASSIRSQATSRPSTADRGELPVHGAFNMVGQPSLALPLAYSASGLPIGMMLTARYGEPATLFRLVGQLDNARPWTDRHPPLWP